MNKTNETEVINLSPRERTVCEIIPLTMCAGTTGVISLDKLWKVIQWISMQMVSDHHKHTLLSELAQAQLGITERNLKLLYAGANLLSSRTRQDIVARCADLILVGRPTSIEVGMYRAVTSLLSSDYLEILSEKARQKKCKLPKIKRNFAKHLCAQVNQEPPTPVPLHPFDVFHDLIDWLTKQLPHYRSADSRCRHILQMTLTSISLNMEEKQVLLMKLPRLAPSQIRDLIKIFKNEREQFIQLQEQHHPEILKTRFQRLLELADNRELWLIDQYSI